MKINIGPNFTKALNAIKPVLNATGKTYETQKATKILEEIVNSYESFRGKGSLAKDAGGISKKSTSLAPRGLLYGKIQSGKTRAMILTSALALDNGFRIVVIATSNINRLVDQTHGDFDTGLPEVKIFEKNDFKESEAEMASIILKRDAADGIVIVCQKGSKVLPKVVDFLKAIDAQSYPALIFDDEGDQSSLDTNINKTDAKKEPSTIHGLLLHEEVDSLQKHMPHNVFVSVTGTPQGLILQSLDSRSKPSFIELLQPGKDYVGGETFFPSPEPDPKLIQLIDPDEKITLMDEATSIPEGLKDAICFFILSATAAGLSLGWKEYKFLCHPSIEQAGHETVTKEIHEFLKEVIQALGNPSIKSSADIVSRLQKQYSELKLTQPRLPSFSTLIAEANKKITHSRTAIINGKTTKDTIRYSQYYNFLVGGNSIGRGLAIKNLLVTYYVREPRTANMDTMYQHARMFGYRKELLPFIRVFLPPQLYSRFHEIYLSDEELRELIKNHGKESINLLIRSGHSGLRPTRNNILPASQVEVLRSGQQIYPDKPAYQTEVADEARAETLLTISKLFPDYQTDGINGTKISTADAIKLLKQIPTNAQNIWDDQRIATYLKAFAIQLGDGLILRYRKAPDRKNVHKDGTLPSGIMGGKEGKLPNNGLPVLWIFDVNGAKRNGWDGSDFIYPTILLPRNATPFFLNKA